ncbi:MAG: tape measure protein, partial [Pyrinomonadaceae bacterium]
MEIQRLTSVLDTDARQLERGLNDAFSKSERQAGDFVNRVNDRLSRIGAGLGSAARVGFKALSGDFDEAITSLTNLTSAGLKAIPVVGAGLSAAFDETSGVMRSAVEKGLAFDDMMKRQSISFTALTGNAGKANRELSILNAITGKSEFGRFAIFSAARDLQVMGRSAEKLPSDILGIAAAASALSNNTAEAQSRMDGMVASFARILELGKVGSRDVRRLVSEGIPVFDILQSSLGKSRQQVKALLDKELLSANDFITLLTADFRKRFGPAADEMMRTLGVQQQKLTAGMTALEGKAFQNLYGTLTGGLGAANQMLRGPGANQIAASINAAASPFTTMMDSAIKAMQSGDVTGGAVTAGSNVVFGLKKGILDHIPDAQSAGSSLASSVLNVVNDIFGTHSPSKEFEQIGIWCAQGFSIGVGKGQTIAKASTQRMMGNVLAQARARANLESLINREPGFLPKLIAGSQARGMNPDHLLNVMAVETSGTFNPAIKNPTSTASGLIQFMEATARALGTTTAEIRKMSATSQLDYVFKYFDKFYGGKNLSTQGAVYGAVGPGRVGVNDSSVLMRRGDRGFEGNAATWDVDRNGLIQQWELATAAINKLGAGINFTAQELLKGGQSSPLSVDFGNAQTMQTPDLAGGAARIFTPSLGGMIGGNFVDEGGKIIGVWDEVNKVLKVTGQIVMTINDDGFEPLTSSINDMVIEIQKRPLAPLIGDFAELNQNIEDNSDAVEKVKAKYSGLRGELMGLGLTSKNMGDIFESSFTDAFTHTQDGFKGMLRTFVLDFAQAVEQMIIKAEAAKLSKLLFGGGNDDEGSGGGGGWFSTLLKIIGLGASAAAGGSSAGAGGFGEGLG